MSQIRVIVTNRKARRNYEILETLECGIVLTGSEVKAIKAGRVSVEEAYAEPVRGEIWLKNMHVGEWPGASHFAHDPLRPRKLLLHARQIKKLIGKVSQRGLTLIPLKIYLKNGLIKVEIGLARGRRSYEKRDVIKRREIEREIRRELKRHY